MVVFWSVTLPVIVFAVVLLWLVLIEFTIVVIIPSSLVVIIPFVLVVTFQFLTNLITLFLFLVKLHSLFVIVFAGVRGAHYRLRMLFLSILSRLSCPIFTILLSIVATTSSSSSSFHSRPYFIIASFLVSRLL